MLICTRTFFMKNIYELKMVQLRAQNLFLLIDYVAVRCWFYFSFVCLFRYFYSGHDSFIRKLVHSKTMHCLWKIMDAKKFQNFTGIGYHAPFPTSRSCWAQESDNCIGDPYTMDSTHCELSWQQCAPSSHFL